MKSLSLIFLLAGAVGLAGCDGHLRSLYVSPLGSPTPHGSIGSTVVRIAGSEDVLAIVERVARELGMQADPNVAHRWFVRTTLSNSFMLALKKEPGYWLISLSDWPTIRRSDQSKQAEAKLCAALEMQVNRTLEATPGNRTLIGDARMDEARVIHVWLRAEGPFEGHGDAFFEVKPENPEYPRWIQHLGGLMPGQSKAVPPWPSPATGNEPNKAPEPTPGSVTLRASSR